MTLKNIKKGGIQFFLMMTLILIYSCSGEDGMDGIDGIDGTDGTDGTNGEDGVSSGIGTLVLTGDITNEEAAAKIAARIGSNTQSILITNTSNLTTVEFPEVDNDLFEQIELPILENIGDLSLIDNPNLVSASLPMLKEMGGITILRNDKLTSLSLPELTALIGGDGLFRSIILRNENIETIDFPKLERTLALDIERNNLLTNINLPVIREATSISIEDNEKVQVIELPLLTKLEGDLVITGSQNLTNLNLSSISDFRRLGIFSTTLFDDQVNAILAQLVSVTPVLMDKTIRLSGQATGQGLIDAQILRDNSNSVLLDN